jgi:hypothetical protein
MILNAYAVLDGFISLLRLFSGLLVIVLAAFAWRQWRRAPLPEQRQTLEDRSYLLFLLSFLLLGLNLASWPLFYLLLQSYVPQWPDVMCIYGVTQVGKGTLGTSRFLPALVETLQFSKPALVFLTGACFVLYWINRRSISSPVLGRVLLGLFILGVVDVVDAGTELAYLVIPKNEKFPSLGCCTVSPDSASRFVPTALIGPENHSLLYGAYYGVNLGMILLLAASLRSARPLAWRNLLPLLAGAALSVVVNAVFLVEIAAPRILHLPEHHCPYDLVGSAPESMLSVALFLGGCFCVGWSFVARCLGRCPETAPFLPQVVRGLYACAIFGYLLSLVLITTELALS